MEEWLKASNMDGTAPFLIVHHKSKYRGFYDVVLDWILLNLPEQRRLFDLRPLPWHFPARHRYAVMIPWLQDPVEKWCPRTYQQVLELSRECDLQKVHVVNRPERLARAGKFEGARLMRGVGLHTPQVVRIDDARRFKRDFFGLSFPFFVREDCGHGGPMIRADTPEKARAIALDQFQEPVAIQLIDLQSPHDGLYRKFRYVVAGDFGVPHHLQVSTEWITRGDRRVINETTRAQEIAYIEERCPFHDLFQSARKALGLDFVAFDYSLDAGGMPVVWEANPYPYLHFSQNTLSYRNEAMHRTKAILLAFYFQCANRDMPEKLAHFLNCSRAVSGNSATECSSELRGGWWQIPMPKKRPVLRRATDAFRDGLRSLRKQFQKPV